MTAPRAVTDRPVPAPRERWPVLATWTLAVLLVPACACGLLVAGAYTGAAAHLALGSRAQDVLTLALLPLLLVTAHRARRGALRARPSRWASSPGSTRGCCWWGSRSASPTRGARSP